MGGLEKFMVAELCKADEVREATASRECDKYGDVAQLVKTLDNHATDAGSVSQCGK